MDGDILIVEVIGNHIVVRTSHGVHEGSLADQLEFILRTYGFEKLFRGKLANMNKIEFRSKDRKFVYFDPEKKIVCCVSRDNMYKIKHIQTEYDNLF